MKILKKLWSLHGPVQSGSTLRGTRVRTPCESRPQERAVQVHERARPAFRVRSAREWVGIYGDSPFGKFAGLEPLWAQPRFNFEKH